MSPPVPPGPRTLDFADHRRDLGQNRHVYAVVSRRAGGLSVGINLNADKVCNFDCPYCQVDRTGPRPDGAVDLARLDQELRALLARVAAGDLWSTPPFDTAAPQHRRLVDLAFAGDGEPTSPPEFAAAAELVRRARDELAPGVPIRLLTNATLLHRAGVRAGLAHIDEPWCKLDAGTEAWFQRVDGTTFPFRRVLQNLRELAALRPITVQSMFCSIGPDRPDAAELGAWVERLREIAAVGTVAEVQVYTVARAPADARVQALSAAELGAIAALARQAGLAARAI